jgi:hypothetical protein
MNDVEVVAAQIGRMPRSPVDVVARCHLGLPVVIEVPPHLDDGTPFPTHYWLTCPLAVIRVSRLESTGGVKQAEARLDADPEFAAAHEAAMVRYAAERDRLIPTDSPYPRPSGGVAGSRRGVKCLHAHYADHAAGNANPVGALTAEDVTPLDCTVACCRDQQGVVERNPEWREPRC